MRFTIHTGLKITPFELHGRKPRTELPNIVKDGKTYLSNWSEMPISAPTRPKIPIMWAAMRMERLPMVMAKTKAEEKQLTENQKSPKKKSSVRYPFKFVEKNYNKKSLEGRFQNKIQTAVSGTESTIKTDTGKIINRKFISGPLFQTERKARKEPAINTSGEINPKNRHCLRGLNGKYGRWDEILRDILNGKLKIVQNPKQPESETEDEDDDDEEMPEETGTPIKVYDTSERNGSYIPIRTSPEEDALQIYTDGETTGENLENQNQIRRSNRNSKQAGTGPSRRHIQGSKIAKRLPSVKYSFTVLQNRNFLKKIFSKKLHTQKNGPSGAPKSHNAEKLKGGTLCGFSTSILSQNMKKLKKTKIFIFGKKSHNAEKKLKGGTLWDFLTSILSQSKT